MPKIYDPDEQALNPYRPIPFYFITTTNPQELSFEAAYAALSNLKQEGFGGIVINRPMGSRPKNIWATGGSRWSKTLQGPPMSWI